jgi:chaperonin GroEL (HSP60 family)
VRIVLEDLRVSDEEHGRLGNGRDDFGIRYRRHLTQYKCNYSRVRVIGQSYKTPGTCSLHQSSKVKVNEKKNRYDDALNATRAAVEGFFSGGRVALLKASLALTTNNPVSTTSNLPTSPDAKVVPTANFDQELGVNSIGHVLTNPPRTIQAKNHPSSSGPFLGSTGCQRRLVGGTMLVRESMSIRFRLGSSIR